MGSRAAARTASSASLEDELFGPVKLSESSVAADFALRLSCAFEADLWHLPSEGLHTQPFKDVPLKGEWSFRVKPAKSVDERKLVHLICQHGSLPFGALGQTSCELELFLLGTGPPRRIFFEVASTAEAPAYKANKAAVKTGWSFAFDPKAFSSEVPWFKQAGKGLQHYRLTVTLLRTSSAALPGRTAFSDVEKVARTAASDSDRTPLCKDVRLVFPRAGKAGLDLWTTTDFLRSTSPFFTSLLDSECAELVTRRSKRARSEAPAPIAHLKEENPVEQEWGDDSDDETDSAALDLAPTGTTEADFEYRQVTIRDYAFSTYRAVLLHLKSGYIAFAPLASSFLNHQPGAPHRSRAEYLAHYAKEYPTLPLPVSPKSVYRLAHLLKLPELRQLALDEIRSSLTIDGAARDVFGPLSVRHDEVRKVIVEFVARNMQQVKATTSWKEQQARVARREIADAGVVMMEIFEAIGST